MPIHMRMRKLRGPHMKKSMPFEMFRTHTQVVNVADLEARFDKGDSVTLDTLHSHGLCTKGHPGQGARQGRDHQAAHRPRAQVQRRRPRGHRGRRRHLPGHRVGPRGLRTIRLRPNRLTRPRSGRDRGIRMREVLRTPGARSLFIASCVARLPMGALGLLLILHTHELTGSYAAGGLASGVYALALGLSNPVLGRVVDRRGQTPVLRVGAPVAAAAIVLVALLPADAPAGVVIACAAATGASQPPVGACMRALWPELLATADRAPRRVRARGRRARDRLHLRAGGDRRGRRLAVAHRRAVRLRGRAGRGRPRLLRPPGLARLAPASRAGARHHRGAARPRRPRAARGLRADRPVDRGGRGRGARDARHDGPPRAHRRVARRLGRRVDARGLRRRALRRPGGRRPPPRLPARRLGRGPRRGRRGGHAADARARPARRGRDDRPDARVRERDARPPRAGRDPHRGVHLDADRDRRRRRDRQRRRRGARRGDIARAGGRGALGRRRARRAARPRGGGGAARRPAPAPA